MDTDHEIQAQILEEQRKIYSLHWRVGFFIIASHLLVILPVMAMLGFLLIGLFVGMSEAGKDLQDMEKTSREIQLQNQLERTQEAGKKAADSLQKMIDKLGLPPPQNFKK